MSRTKGSKNKTPAEIENKAKLLILKAKLKRRLQKLEQERKMEA